MSTRTSPEPFLSMPDHGVYGHFKRKRQAELGTEARAAAQQSLLRTAPITTNATRSTAMANALAAAMRVRQGGSY